jgi:Mrp family chromosome partitioning ATPase
MSAEPAASVSETPQTKDQDPAAVAVPQERSMDHGILRFVAVLATKPGSGRSCVERSEIGVQQ